MKDCEEDVKPARKPVLVPIRKLIADIAHISVICFCIVAMRTMLIMSDQVKALSAELTTQVTTGSSTLQTNVKDIAISLNLIAKNHRVLIDRLDSQFTSTRIEMSRAQKTEKVSRIIQESPVVKVSDLPKLLPPIQVIVPDSKQGTVTIKETEPSVTPEIQPKVEIQIPAPKLEQKDTTPKKKGVINKFTSWMK